MQHAGIFLLSGDANSKSTFVYKLKVGLPVMYKLNAAAVYMKFSILELDH